MGLWLRTYCQSCPEKTGTRLFLQDGRHFLSALMIQKNFTGLQCLIEYFKFDTLYAGAAGLWTKMHFSKSQNLYNQPMSIQINKPTAPAAVGLKD